MDRANRNAGVVSMLVIVGLVIAGIGLIWVFAPQLPRSGQVPGDILIERGNSRIYFPVVTYILIGVVLSLVLSAFRS